MWSEIAASFQEGNGYVLAMMALAFVSLVIIIERLIMLTYVYNINFRKFVSNIRKAVASDDLERARSICKAAGHTSLPGIAIKAVDAALTDVSTVRGVIEEEALDFFPKVEARLMSLPAIATLLLLMGILGTIDELWSSFHSVGVLDTSKKQAVLAQGISSSLNPTAIGLICSMIILAFHQTLKGLAINLTEKTHHGLTVITNLLAPAQMAPAFFQPMEAQASYESAEQTTENVAGGELNDETFDDAAVEDIKDEEEII